MDTYFEWNPITPTYADQSVLPMHSFISDDQIHWKHEKMTMMNEKIVSTVKNVLPVKLLTPDQAWEQMFWNQLLLFPKHD